MKKQKYDFSQMTGIEIYKLVLQDRIKTFPRNFWHKPDSLKEAGEITRYLIEEILKWNDEDIKNNLTIYTFKENKLYGMIQQVFNCSPYAAVNNAYPNKFLPWELLIVEHNYWNLETGIKATKWLLEEKLKWNDEDIKRNFNQNIFIKNKLGGMLIKVFNNTAYNALNAAYPNKFKEWELSTVPKGFWNKNKIIEATKWLLEEKLKWNYDDIINNLSIQTFSEYGLYGVLYPYKNSIQKLLKEVYPEQNWEMFATGIRKSYRNK